MRVSRLHLLAGIGALLCVCVPNARAAWGSIHGNNRGGAIPARPPGGGGFHGAPGGGVAHNAPAFHAPPVRQEAPYFENRGGGFARVPEQNLGRYRAWEGDRFRGGFDEDWGHSFYWSHYHPGMFINVLPPDYFQFSIGGAPFYYDQGVYYQPEAGGYVVAAPPIGAVVPTLPPGAQSILEGNSVLYYADGAFYAPAANGYQVVTPPLGVTVSMLPADATTVVINGTTYYQSNGVYYLPVMQDGVTVYETVQPQ